MRRPVPHSNTQTPATTPKRRCAVYTRKSTDEGLDMEYNSLEAQRDAGLAYIASQRHEGWIAVGDGYDDGGFSGGNVERPALQRLMGATPTEPVLLQAHSGEAMRKKPGRTEYQRGIVTRDADGRLSVRTTGNQGSGVLRSMVEANGLIVLHHGQGNVAPGDLVDVMMFDGAI